MIATVFQGQPAIVLGTGPSLQGQSEAIRRSSARIFGINNTYRDFDLDVFTACDPTWWETFGRDFRAQCPDLLAYHWDRGVCEQYGAEYIEGRWGDGLSLDPNYIHYGHSSGYQALNIAVLMGCDPIYLAGYDMDYPVGQPRHYFTGLSDSAGEYPAHLRKWSTFDGLRRCYETIAAQQALPRIINCTRTSALRCFEFGDIPG